MLGTDDLYAYLEKYDIDLAPEFDDILGRCVLALGSFPARCESLLSLHPTDTAMCVGLQVRQEAVDEVCHEREPAVYRASFCLSAGEMARRFPRHRRITSQFYN